MVGWGGMRSEGLQIMWNIVQENEIIWTLISGKYLSIVYTGNIITGILVCDKIIYIAKEICGFRKIKLLDWAFFYIRWPALILPCLFYAPRSISPPPRISDTTPTHHTPLESSTSSCPPTSGYPRTVTYILRICFF